MVRFLVCWLTQTCVRVRDLVAGIGAGFGAVAAQQNYDFYIVVYYAYNVTRTVNTYKQFTQYFLDDSPDGWKEVTASEQVATTNVANQE